MERSILDDEVRWGILGVGDVCEVKSAPAMNIVNDSRLVAVMRRDARLAADYARRHAVPRWYSDATALIGDPEVNAIYIATPPYAHKELALQAAAAGKPVYVEKPMARTYKECQAMIAACRDANVALHVAYYRRALPHFAKIKELLTSGVIGEVRNVRIELNQQLLPQVVGDLEHNWRVNPEIAGGGYFYDLASHQLDLLDWILGPIETACGVVANQAGQYPAEDTVTAAFRFQSGVPGSGSWCFATGQAAVKDETTIIGSEGQITFATFGAGRFVLHTNANGEQAFEFELPEHIQHNLIEVVVNDLLGKGNSPSTGESAARTNRVIDEIFGRI
jgi:predicted dehydrogenase